MQRNARALFGSVLLVALMGWPTTAQGSPEEEAVVALPTNITAEGAQRFREYNGLRSDLEYVAESNSQIELGSQTWSRLAAHRYRSY